MPTKDLNIDIHYVTRVEGHGNIVVNAKNGKIENIEWQITEAPRFFEAMVVGQKWDVVHHITSRICGICSIAHSLSSLKATEAALSIKISEQTARLRRVAIHAENPQSHILHIGYLALPDLMGAPSVLPLAKSYPEEVKTIVRLHRLANKMSDLTCGRTTHPQRLIPGGFTKLPTSEELINLREEILKAEEDVIVVAQVLKSKLHVFPKFERETEYVGTIHDDEYALYDGDLASTDGGRDPVKKYLSWTNEYIVPQSTAKFTKRKRDSLMVGALARYNINHKLLTNDANHLAKLLDLKAPCYNPFFNTVAQLVECMHSFQDSVRLIDELLKDGLKEEKPKIKVRAGHGVGAVEAPRGILIHDYEYDKHGVCKRANSVIPTNQNHANIQKDMEVFLPQIIAEKTKPEIELALEMLVRAYDPCISCSTHMLKVEFK
ncbi:MAG: Ni/Fe hydrogenase subunit alpha [Pseudomonadota bacterium]